MKKGKVWLCLVLAALMVFATACSSNNGSNTETPTNTSEAANNPEPKEEPYEIVLGYPVLGEVPADIDAVEAEINKITLEKINATVKLSRITIGQWFQQKNLILAGNEKMDLILTDFQSYSPAVAKNQFLAQDELLEQYGQGIKEIHSESLEVARINGKIFATPVKSFAEGGTAVLMRKDLLDKHGIEVSDIQGTQGLDKVFETIKKNEPEMTVFAVPNSPKPMTGLIDGLYVDTLTDGLGVLPMNSSEMKVVNLYEMPEYVEALKQLRSWYVAGYFPKDAANSKANATDLVKSGSAFSVFEGNSVFIEDTISSATGFEMVKVVTEKPLLSTQAMIGLSWAIPQNAQNPQKAMEFLNLTFTDQDIINLINFGIEGKHYTKKSDNVIALIPDGGYRMNQGFMFGNRLLTYVLDGENPALREENVKFAESLPRSPAVGFLPSTDAVNTEVVAVMGVLEQYRKALETGNVDPEKIHPDFVAKLKAAGIDTIIAAKQEQLDAWLAQQK